MLETSLIGKALDFGPREYRFESCVSKYVSLNSYSNFLNQFSLCLLRKHIYVETRLTTKARNLANLFIHLSLLRRISKTDNQTWRLFPLYQRQRRMTRTITVYNLTSSKKILSFRALRILNLNCPFSYYILETTQGLMTHKTAIRRKLGGFLICAIF